jgi:hypothetical protein
MEKIYQIKRSTTASSLADNIILLASRSNAVALEDRVSIDDMISYIKSELLLFPFTHKDLSFEKINDYQFVMYDYGRFLLEISEIEIHNDIPTLDAYNNLN